MTTKSEQTIREYWYTFYQYSSCEEDGSFPPEHYSTNFLREMKDIFHPWQWRMMSYNKNFLTEEQLIEFKDYINWAGIAQSYKLSKDFIIKHKNLLPWWSHSSYECE